MHFNSSLSSACFWFVPHKQLAFEQSGFSFDLMVVLKRHSKALPYKCLHLVDLKYQGSLKKAPYSYQYSTPFYLTRSLIEPNSWSIIHREYEFLNSWFVASTLRPDLRMPLLLHFKNDNSRFSKAYQNYFILADFCKLKTVNITRVCHGCCHFKLADKALLGFF